MLHTRPIAFGVEMPVIAMGTPHSATSICCGGGALPVNHTCCDAAMRDAALLWWATGGVAVETSMAYGTGIGLGQALTESRLPRESVFIHGKVQCRATATAVMALIHEHLAEIGIRYFDLLTIHYPAGVPARGVPSCGGANLSSTWGAFEAARAAGLTRAIGSSGFNVSWLSSLFALGGPPPAYNQYAMEVAASPSDLQHVLTFCRSHNVSVGGFSSLSHDCLGLLAVASVAAAHNRTTADVCLRWVTQQGAHAVVSSTRAGYDTDDLRSTSFSLTADDMRLLSSLSPSLPYPRRLWGRPWRQGTSGRRRFPSPPSPPPQPTTAAASAEVPQLDDFGCPTNRGSHSCDV